MSGQRICRVCGNEQDIEQFRHCVNPDYRRRTCMKCECRDASFRQAQRLSLRPLKRPEPPTLSFAQLAQIEADRLKGRKRRKREKRTHRHSKPSPPDHNEPSDWVDDHELDN